MTEHETNIPLHVLQEIASNVMFAAEADTIEQVLTRIAHAARQLVNAKYAAIGIPDGKGGLRYFQVSGLSDDMVAKIAHPPRGAGLLGVIMNERQSLRLENMLDDARASGFPDGHPEMTSLLGVPVQVGQQLYGMLYLTDREDGESFSLQDQWLIETLAGYVALAIIGSQLRENERRLTLMEERERISMGLHDGVIQSLYALGMRLALMNVSEEENVRGLQLAIDGLNDVIEDIRRYIMNLKAPTYGEKTMKESLYEIISRLYVPKDMVVDLDAPDRAPPFSDDVFESICLMTGEALSNAIRHAGASRVSVRCWHPQDEVRVVVRDDGAGFDLTALEEHEGLGLRNLQERASMLGGTVEIESAPGAGTILRISIPLGR